MLTHLITNYETGPVLLQVVLNFLDLRLQRFLDALFQQYLLGYWIVFVNDHPQSCNYAFFKI